MRCRASQPLEGETFRHGNAVARQVTQAKVERGASITQSRSSPIPVGTFILIDAHADAVKVIVAKISHRVRKLVLCGEVHPMKSPRWVAPFARALAVAECQVVLRLRVALTGGLFIPSDRCLEVCVDPVAMLIAGADVELRSGVIFFGRCKPEPEYTTPRATWSVSAKRQSIREPEQSIRVARFGSLLQDFVSDHRRSNPSPAQRRFIHSTSTWDGDCLLFLHPDPASLAPAPFRVLIS